ncbi:MAG TPA: methylmalonyl-CoA mutase family protein [Solirubrobacteraceae bacterium]|jgi:methylmalonyl-CoA mutase N-terminal domain/subunit
MDDGLRAARIAASSTGLGPRETGAGGPGSLVGLLQGWVSAGEDGHASLGPSSPDQAKGPHSTSAKLPLPLSYDTGGETPGSYPYTRGRSARLYHDELWVMGQYSGYATPAETRARFDQLLQAGQTGLSIALDLPTQMGLDSDHPLALGEVGKVGVPLDTVEDLLALFRGLPLDQARQLRTTANAIGPIFAAFLLVALEELGVSTDNFRLLLQNDPLKEYAARGTFIFPPRAAVSLTVDVIEYFAKELPHWEPVEFCGYHIRDAGATAIQEIAIATANGLEYLDEAARRGVDIEACAHSLYLFMSAAVDIFEEAAKIRAARRLWARLLHERYGVRREACGINVFAYTLGGALVAQEPINNVVRVACETLAAALGGVQTMATSSYDEALGLPSAAAAHLALRTQQVVAYESGVTKVVDPLAGSYYVEDLTDRLEAEAVRYLLRIVELGGAVEALDRGFIGEEIASAAYEQQLEVESGERPVVGMNIHRSAAEGIERAFTVPEHLQREQVESLMRVRAGRDETRLRTSLDALSQAAAQHLNTIPYLIEAARSRASIGEVVDALASALGRHRDRGGLLGAGA